MFRRPVRSSICTYICQTCVSRGVEPFFSLNRWYHCSPISTSSQLDSHSGNASSSFKPRFFGTDLAIAKDGGTQTAREKGSPSAATSTHKVNTTRKHEAQKKTKPKIASSNSTKKLPKKKRRLLQAKKTTEAEGKSLKNKRDKSKKPVRFEKAGTGGASKLKRLLSALNMSPEFSSAEKSSREPPLVRSASPVDVRTLDMKDIQLNALVTESDAVPSLSYGLDRILFNPGVYHLQDPRSMVYNFDPYLREIMPVSEFDFKALNDYITSSKDTTLRDKAVEIGKKYIGSSSSMTNVLSHFHFLLSNWRELNTTRISKDFPIKLRTFTKISRVPAAIFLRYDNGVYAIDADKEMDTANVLMGLGKSMEKLLTMPTEQFEKYRKSNVNRLDKIDNSPEVYHYSTCGDFLMRSQLDAHDSRLPGTGMFDLKTRAVLSIRMNAKEPEEGAGYQIKSNFGHFESFEREYFDMMRAAFLKYHLQVRIGRMDGIFVAFHNTERIFGFQYISLPEMDLAIHGQESTTLGDSEFKLSLGLWNDILNMVTEQFPKQTIRFHFETRETLHPFMYVFAEPMSDEEADEIQARAQSEIEEYEKRVFYPELCEETDTTEVKPDVPELETEESEICLASDSPEDNSAQKPKEIPERPLLAMAISLQNFVNGRRVIRPRKLKQTDTWTVNYRVSKFGGERAWKLYEACKLRRYRSLKLEKTPDSIFLEQFKEMSASGREWRKARDALEMEKGIVQYTHKP
ncbi:hypothetical protein FQN57_001217 [Myotisia sp. PD_48]|nr:hypothetical protein FQN57_001217 [Myotisia sp. PD_48]